VVVAVPPAIVIIAATISTVTTISAVTTISIVTTISTAAVVFVDAEIARQPRPPTGRGNPRPRFGPDAGRAADLPIKIDPIVDVAGSICGPSLLSHFIELSCAWINETANSMNRENKPTRCTFGFL
jgi:hypothetical protein